MQEAKKKLEDEAKAKIKSRLECGILDFVSFKHVKYYFRFSHYSF